MISVALHSAVFERLVLAFIALLFVGLLAACGGGTDTPPAGNGQPPAVAIIAQPTDQSAVARSTATFSVTATNATGYQWQRSIDTGVSFTNVAGAVSASHTTAATTLADSGAQYRVIVSGALDSVTSSVVRLTVAAASTAPVITSQPTSVTITAGQSTQFTVAARGSPTPNIQWQLSTDGGLNFSSITGATNAVFEVLNAAQANNGRQFRAVASNSAGSVNSDAAVLTVNAASAGGNIVFTRAFGIQSTPSDVLLIKEDGSGEMTLAATEDDEQFLGTTPGGRVVYARTPAGGVPGIYSINVDGSGAILLVGPVSATDFIRFYGITLNGWVIYQRTSATTGRDLYAVKADGTSVAPVALANAAGNEDFAAITASGKVIYQAETTFNQYDVFSVNADGTDKVALAAATDLREGWAGQQSAGQIAISKCNFVNNICDYISVNENGGVANLLARETFAGQFRVTGVTKAGRFVVSGINVPNFQPGSQSDLYIDSTNTPLANSLDNESYAGSTADGRVLYQRLVPIPNTSRFSNDLYIVNADGTNSIRLAANAALVAVAPDGRIVYATLSNNDPIRLSTVNADGTGAVELGNSPNTVAFFQGITADGRVIFSREDGSVSGLSLRAINTDGTGETLLAVRSYFVANTPSGKVVMRDNDNGNTNVSIVNPDGTGFIRLATTGNNEFFNVALP